MMYSLARSLLFQLDPERAHDLGLKAMSSAWRLGMNPLLAHRPDDLPVDVFGIRFPNPVGLAAGMDKNGSCIRPLSSLGFGFIEIGTTTPRPQTGNPKPRMFRLPEHKAIINRLGFNNDGVDVLVRNVERSGFDGVLGINIGKNKDTPNDNAIDDYLHCLERVYPLASYVTVNISSPNTQGLRDLQDEQTLKRFLGTLRERQEQLAGQHGRRVPMLLKIAPDLEPAQMDAIAAVVLEAEMDGLICTNTTTDRSIVAGHPHGEEAGGLSGAPLMQPSTRILREMALRLSGRVPLIGVGGICTGADAAAKLQAGASLVQFYSGMIYAGPTLIRDCVETLRVRRQDPTRPAPSA